MTEVFNTAGKKAGLQVWRVESMKLVENSDGLKGSFHTGDAYLVLQTKEGIKYGKLKIGFRNKHHLNTFFSAKGGRLSWDLHFWLGLESSQDERGAAAVLTTQMDEHLGGGPVQYRQIQGYENAKFMSLYPNGVKYKVSDRLPLWRVPFSFMAPIYLGNWTRSLTRLYLNLNIKFYMQPTHILQR